MVEAVAATREHSFGDQTEGDVYLAGGTTLVDLMKLQVLLPNRVIDLTGASTEYSAIIFDGTTLRLGAFAKMAAVAKAAVIKEQFPVVAESLALAASAQIRNMATLGGNVLQRTRCPYFRDPSWQSCNKRSPGSGCAALHGFNRQHAVLGASENCIATYHGDFAQSLIALDASVTLVGTNGARSIPFATLHATPGHTPHLETQLRPGEIITEFVIQATPAARRSRYVKIRDRQSYEFAVASVAVALDLREGVISDVRIALGGVATIPWRAAEAEDILRGQRLDEKVATVAAEAAFADAKAQSHNRFKIELGRAAIMRALFETAAMEIRHG